MTNQSANQNSVAGTSKDQTARKIALNSVLNFLGAVLPMLVGLATIPSLLHSLGNERFAILSLMWSIIIYFSVFDFGIGRAVTKFVAEYAARNRTPSLRRLVPSAILLQLVIGVVLACVVAAIVPFIVGSLKDLPSNMVRETTVSLYLLVVSLPLMFGANAARGALEGQHRFGLVNSIRVPSTVSVFLFPWIAVQFSPILEISVTSLVFSRALVFVAYLVFAIRAFPPIGSVTARLVTLYIKKLASYGGWVALGVCLGSLMAMAYLDRFLIGSILSVGDLAYYSAPFEIIARLLVIPAAFVTVLFPLFSALTKEKTIALHDRSVRYVAIVFLPVVMFVFVMAHDFLSIWIDVEFAVRAAPVLQILAVGVLFHGVAYVPSAAIQALGRPDLTALRHVIELPIYVFALVVALRSAALLGAATVWAAWALFDSILLLFLLRSVTNGESALKVVIVVSRQILWPLLFIVAIFIVAWTISMAHSIQGRVLGVILLIFAIEVGAWKILLNVSERRVVNSRLLRIFFSKAIN